MTYLNFTESEKEIIRNTLKLIIKDIDKLWSYDMCSKICIPVTLEDVDKYYEGYPASGWLLMLTKDNYVIENANSDQRFLIATKKENEPRIDHTDTIGPVDVMILKEYPNIRKFIVGAIRDASARKNETLEYIRNLGEQIKAQTTIEIDLPPTNNRQTIEVTEENGKKVGTINFGDMALKIITSSEANIEFKNKKEEEPKTKRI